MRAAAIFGLRSSPENLTPFQTDETVEWRIGLPAAADQADIVLLFGGDGTIHRHLKPLASLGLPVLIVPVGSGNDFARALGLRRVADSLVAWQRFCAGQGHVRAVDLGIIIPLESASPPSGETPQEPSPNSQTYFCSVAGIGFDSDVARRANELPAWLREHGGYALSVAPALFHFRPLPMNILTASETGIWTTRSDQPTLLAAFANTSAYGGGMKIAPQAKMDDGQLDVCIIGGISPFKLACMFPTVYFGRHLRIPEVDYFQTAQVRVKAETPLDVYADGEYVCTTPVEVGVQRGALKVLVL